MMAKIRQLNLTASQWLAFVKSVFKIAYYRIALKFRSYQWLEQRKNKDAFINNKNDVAGDLIYAQQMHESVRLASRLVPFKAECLPRSLMLDELLREKRINTRIVIGVAKNEEAKEKVAILSHAWVEVHGQAIGEPEDLKEKFAEVGV